MTLIEQLLKKVQSKESIRSKYASPPPELDEASIERRVRKKRRKPINRYPHVVSKVDSSPPALRPRYMLRHAERLAARDATLCRENFKLLTKIRMQQFNGGKVDCHWDRPPEPMTHFFEKRKRALIQMEADNKIIYKMILSTKARVNTTAYLERCWQQNRRQMVSNAIRPFVLFPPEPKEDVDPVFLAPPGVTRPRVRIYLRVVGGASLGSLTLELFSDVCPLTCRLFAELLRPAVQHSYIGTCFFTKVPNLYWSGGDVILDNGFGCYMQSGRVVPLGAENYHYPHSMPGLVSMRVTCDDEMCGIFNITFKPLPQFDLKNVVFARVVRPCSTYETTKSFGSALSTQPVVRIECMRFLRGRDSLDQPVIDARRNSSLGLLEQTALLLESLSDDKLSSDL